MRMYCPKVHNLLPCIGFISNNILCREKVGGRNVEKVIPKQKVKKKKTILADEFQLSNCRKKALKKLGFDEIRTRASQFTTQIWVGLVSVQECDHCGWYKKYFVFHFIVITVLLRERRTYHICLTPKLWLPGSVSGSAQQISGKHGFKQRRGLNFFGLSLYFYIMQKPKYFMFH